MACVHNYFLRWREYIRPTSEKQFGMNLTYITLTNYHSIIVVIGNSILTNPTNFTQIGASCI